MLVCDRHSAVQARFDKGFDVNCLRDELVAYLKDKRLNSRDFSYD